MIHRLAILALVSAALAAGLNATDEAGEATARLVTNPWDANAWDPASGNSFWREGVEKRKDEAAQKPSVSPSPNQAPAKPVFPNRQPEK